MRTSINVLQCTKIVFIARRQWDTVLPIAWCNNYSVRLSYRRRFIQVITNTDSILMGLSCPYIYTGSRRRCIQVITNTDSILMYTSDYKY